MTDEDPGFDDSQPGAGIVYEIDEEMRPSEAVVRAVASLTDASILDLPPLYDVIDPERLDEIVDLSDMDDVIDGVEFGGERSVSFRYAGSLVKVTPDTVSARLDD